MTIQSTFALFGIACIATAALAQDHPDSVPAIST